MIFLARPERAAGETKDTEKVRAISQCQSTHGAVPIRSTTANERQEKIVEGTKRKRERGEKERMNDGRPSLLRLITCPSFVRVYFSLPHLSLLVLFCISAVTNGRPPFSPSFCLFDFIFLFFHFSLRLASTFFSPSACIEDASFHSCKKIKQTK